MNKTLFAGTLKAKNGKLYTCGAGESATTRSIVIYNKGDEDGEIVFSRNGIEFESRKLKAHTGDVINHIPLELAEGDTIEATQTCGVFNVFVNAFDTSKWARVAAPVAEANEEEAEESA